LRPERYEVMRDLEPVVESLLPSLRPVDACWQPSDFLPRTGSPTWREEIEALREDASRLSDAMLVVLVGNVVTEEGLPLYLAELNRFHGEVDDSGTATDAWARWNRGWTAEEKRHGDLTRAYVYLSGRVDLKSVEATVQHLLRAGFDTRSEGDPYRGLAYASFQEHATKIAWSQLGKAAGAVGSSQLHRICGVVAADEARHERVYVSLLREVVKRDPEGAVESLVETLGRAIVMPARAMTDGHDRRLFAHFAEVGQRLGVYTIEDYVENLEQLITVLGLEVLSLSGEAAEARDRICELPARQRALYEMAARPSKPVPFRWIHDRSA
jgi:acyl-[acyl-carrier-protein] desaturase